MQKHRLKFTDEQVNEFAKYYNAGHSVKEVANKFKILYRDALHYLIYSGHYIPKKKNTFSKNMCENPHYFKKIDNSEKAYFLGLLMSDGYIVTSLYNKEVGIALQSRDLYILEELNKRVSPNKVLSKYKNSYKWKVASSEMYEDLLLYNITEDKSHSEYIFPDIPKEYHRDFIRGYFDGDGCITIKSTGFSVISFCSNSIKFLLSLAEVLFENNIHTRPIYKSKENKKGNSLYTLYLSGGINKSIFKKFLYKDATLYLKRKYEKFKGIPC